MPEPQPLLAAAAALVLLGVVASKISARLGVPALLLFLAIGMLAGSEGIGGIDFTDHELAQSVGIVALAFILFAGGLDTAWRDVRPVVGSGAVLATAGVAATALVVGAVASWVFDFSLTTGLLLGAIVSSTDAAAVFSVLRSHNVRLRGHVRPLLELESGSNDPMAVFLTVGFLTLLEDRSTTAAELVPLFVQQMAVGAVVGYGLARLTVIGINRIRLEYDGLYPVMTIGVVVLVYGTTSLLEGSGFLAVYLAGLVMGNSRFLHKKSLTQFHDAIAWLSQISMFLVLGLLVFPSDLVAVAPRALLISGVLVFVARPLATMVCLPTRRFPVRQKLLISWVGLRGAVPIILATFPLVEGVADAELIFNVVFFTVLTSVMVQGTTVALAARRLGVATHAPPRRRSPLEFVPSGRDDMDIHELEVRGEAPAAGKRLVELGLPAGALVVLISRDGGYVVPQGGTRLEPGDSLLVLAPSDALEEIRALIELRDAS